MIYLFADMCLGSAADNDDIVGCTWVGYNISGDALIKDGCLWINGRKIWNLAQIRPMDPSEENVDLTLAQNNVFRMEPGRTVFITCRLCNEAELCTNKSLGSITMMGANAVLKTSVNGSAISISAAAVAPIGRRKRQASNNIVVLTPSGESEVMVTEYSTIELRGIMESECLSAVWELFF